MEKTRRDEIVESISSMLEDLNEVEDTFAEKRGYYAAVIDARKAMEHLYAVQQRLEYL